MRYICSCVSVISSLPQERSQSVSFYILIKTVKWLSHIRAVFNRRLKLRLVLCRLLMTSLPCKFSVVCLNFYEFSIFYNCNWVASAQSGRCVFPCHRELSHGRNRNICNCLHSGNMHMCVRLWVCQCSFISEALKKFESVTDVFLFLFLWSQNLMLTVTVSFALTEIWLNDYWWIASYLPT